MKSHRDIKGETLTGKPKIKTPEKVNHKKPELELSKPYRRKIKLKKIGNQLLETIAGENKIGEALHGILDLVPFPNQAIAKLASSSSKDDAIDRKEEVKKLLSVRNIVAVLVFVLILTGVITVEDAVSLLKALINFV